MLNLAAEALLEGEAEKLTRKAIELAYSPPSAPPRTAHSLFLMAKVTHHGWSTSSDDIPQSNSILMGRNLRRPEPASSPDVSKPFGHDLAEIRRWCEQHDLHVRLKGEDKK